jgi:hypothetical protein
VAALKEGSIEDADLAVGRKPETVVVPWDISKEDPRSDAEP